MNSLKTKLVAFCVIIILMIISTFFVSKIIKLREENSRLSNNFKESKFKLDSVITKNGDLVYSVHSLELKKSEIEDYDENLKKELKDMGIKLKNFEAVIELDVDVEYRTDTVKIKQISDTSYICSYGDKWLNSEQRLILTENGKKPRIDSVSVHVDVDLDIYEEIEYKGWWFWKKAKGIKIHVKSDDKNPYLKIDAIKTIKIVK